MKRISTLLTAWAALFTVHAKAQFFEDFEDPYKIDPVNCWNYDQVYPYAYGINTFFDFRLTENGSMVSDPPVNETQTSDLLTPALNITSTSFEVRFNYRTNLDVKGKTYRTIEIGLQDASGYTFLDKVTVNSSTVDPMSTKAYNKTFILTSTGAKRLVFKFGGDAGAGNVRLIFDDLYANASPRYASGCNSAPIAIDDNFVASTMGAYSNNVVINTVGGTDNEPDGEDYSAITLISQPPASQGVVTIDNSGNFTFKPSPSFTGGTVTFTYQLTDNGYTALSSNIATVTIQYLADLIILPVKLMSFGGELKQAEAQLNWAVAENESGAHFEVLRSRDGKNFERAGLVFASSKSGAESYQFIEKTQAEGTIFYQLSMVNKDGSVSLSHVIRLQETSTAEGNTLHLLKNPVESTLRFTFTSPNAEANNVALYNMAGVKVFSTRINSHQGINTVSLNLDSRVVTGMYVLEVSGATQRRTTKLVKK